MSMAGGGGAISSAFVEISANTQEFDQQINALVNSLANRTFTISVDADTQQVTVETEQAVDRADGTKDIDADTAGVSGQISTAVDSADGVKDIDADTAGVGSEISTAVDGADGTKDIDADTAGVSQAVSTAVDSADGVIDVDADVANARSRIASLEAQLADVTLNVEADTAAAQDRIEQLENELDELRSTGESTARGLSVSFRSVATVVGGILAGSFAQVGIEFNQLQQTSRAALSSLLDGASAATAQMAELNEFASESPFPRQEFIAAQQTLIAFGVAAEDVVPTLSAIQDGLAASGQAGSEIGEISRIFGQIQSAGRITAEELNQFAERGVNAAQLIGNEMGLTAGEIREQITAGAIDAETALTNLRIGMQREFDGAAANVRGTFAGARDSVRASLRDISSAMFSTFVDPEGGGAAVDFFNDLADSIRSFSNEASASISAAGGSLVPLMQSLGQDLLPAVALSLAELVPLLGTTGTLTQALVPIFQVVGTVLEAIPGPVLQMVTAFAALQRLNVGSRLVSIGQSAAIVGLQIRDFGARAAAAQVQTGSWRNALRSTGRGLGGLISAIGPAGVATAGLAVGMSLLAQRQQEAAQEAADAAQRVDVLRQALAEADTVAEGLELGLEQLAEGGDSAASGIAAAGITSDQLRGFFVGATDQTDALRNAVDEARIGNEVFRDTFRETGDASEAYGEAVDDAGAQLQQTGGDAGLVEAIFRSLTGTQDESNEATRESIRTWSDQVNALDDAADALNEVAQAEFDEARLAGELTDAQIDQIESAEFLAGAWFELREELDALEVAQRENITLSAIQARNAGELTDAQLREVNSAESAAQAQDTLNAALDTTTSGAQAANTILREFEGATGGVADRNRDVAASLRQVDTILNAVERSAEGNLAPWETLDSVIERAGVNMDEVDGASGALELSMANLAVAIDAAGLSGDDLSDIAASLGVTVQDLESFVGATVGVVNDFTSAVESNIPTVSEALGELDDLTLTGVRDSVLDTLDAIEQFADDIDTLSIRPAIQRLAIEEGPELAAVLADAQRDGNDAMLDEIEQGLIDIDGARQGLIDDARVFAVEFAVAMGFIAENGVEAFAELFDIESPTLDEINSSGDALSDAALGKIAEETGRDTRDGYGRGIEGMDRSAREETNRTGDALSDAAIAKLEPDANRAGVATREGYRTGLVGMATDAAKETDLTATSIRAGQPQMTTAGFIDGNAAKTGFNTGISGMPADAGATANRTVFAIRSREGPGRSAGNQVGGAIKGGVDSGLSGVVGNVINDMVATANGVAGQAGRGRSSGSSVGRGIKGGVNSGLSGLTGEVRKSVNAAARAAGDAKTIAFSQGSSVGGDIGSGMVSGINSQRGSVISAAVSLARDAANGAKAELAIASPSRVFKEIGEDVGLGLRDGILEEITAVSQASRDLAAAVTAAGRPTIPGVDVDSLGSVSNRGDTAVKPAGAVGDTLNLNIQRGAVVVQADSTVSARQATEIGRGIIQGIEQGFSRNLARRRVQVDARTT